MKSTPAFGVEISENKKIGPVSATYVSQESCPPECPFMGKGCFAEGGIMGIHTSRLNGSARGETPEEFATMEAAAIDELSGRFDLRVHVVGDCQTPAAATIVAAAMKRHRRKRNRSAWSYTHAWRDVPAKAWLGESVLASVETTTDAKKAGKAGYAVALVLESFEGHTKAYMKDGVKILPCKEQIDGTQCVDCRWCFNGEALQRTGTVIGLLAHGGQKGRVILTLQKLTLKAKKPG